MKTPITTDVQRLAVESFRTFLASEVTPVARLFEGRSIPAQKMRELTQGIAEFGLPGASIMQSLGGMGLSAVTEALLFEELRSASRVVAESVLGNLLVASALAGLPSSQQSMRERFLPDLLAGRGHGGFCLEQAEGVSAWPTDDGWVINGNQQRFCNRQCVDVLVTPLPAWEGVCCFVVVEGGQDDGGARNDPSYPAQVTFSDVRLPADLSDAQTRWIDQVLTRLRGDGCNAQ
ncbi:acyl-CoA dehydrogenase family protein [Pseudomonas alkylphenolica]|uniref:acyl-CoA dehydrogenase family protein n=1 Tax=Pseudomonas alkylphenolica TaxID=237609 RepID=UPI0018D630CC|nr:acyl-CoA dehydrogenase family protein [Pseudomonas alkylphenolica]MBH3429659.1 acyl-CoA/acyl-ACP dehydrogenase [Pseudomonas alkylphenolica]